MTQNEELSYVMAQKAALVGTVNSSGWPLVKQIADKIAKRAIQEALDAEDGTGESKRLKAKALQKGFDDLFAHIEAVKNFDPHPQDDSGLGELETAPEPELAE
jgi:hypothetical protein